MGRDQEVLVDGAPRTVTVDADYLRRALLLPSAEALPGYPLGTMPAVPPERVDDVLAAVLALTPTPPASPGWFVVMGLGALAFVGGHLGLSADPLRPRLVARLGEGRFMGLYSLPVAAGLGLLVWGWARAPFVAVWDPPTWTRWIPLLVMPFVVLGQVAGYTTVGPTVAGMAGSVAAAPRGIHRVTRHPANLTMALWAAAHLCVNGDLAGILLFASVLGLGVAGSLHIDARRARRDPEAWARYAAVTSLVPFQAIVEGRNQLVLREIGLWRFVVSALLYGAALWAHSWVIGASPWP